MPQEWPKTKKKKLLFLCIKKKENTFVTFNSTLSCAWRWVLLPPNRSPTLHPTSTHYLIIYQLFSPLGHVWNVSLLWPDSAESLIYVLIVSCPDSSGFPLIVFPNPWSLKSRGVLGCFDKTTDSCSWKECSLYWSNICWPNVFLLLLLLLLFLNILVPHWLVMIVWLENGWD